MIAASLAMQSGSGFSALVSAMEHHSNFVPWQQAALQTGGVFNVIPLDSKGDIDLGAYVELLEKNPAGVVSLAHVSNVLGTVNPLKKLITLAHQRGWMVAVDAAQSVRHEPVDVTELDCEFLCFSGHKTMGPTGIGVLYGKEELLNELPPLRSVGRWSTLCGRRTLPSRGRPCVLRRELPNYVGAIALSSALNYLKSLDLKNLRRREHALLQRAERLLSEVEGVRIVGSPCKRAGVISFTIEGSHSFDIATLMDKMGVAIRFGSQCAQPLLNETYSLGNAVRISPASYNTFEEIDAAIYALERAISICRR